MADSPFVNIEKQLSELASEANPIKVRPDLGERCRQIASVRQRNRRIFASLAGLAFLITGWTVTAWRNATIDSLPLAQRESSPSRAPSQDITTEVALMHRDLLALRLKRASLMVEWDEYQTRRQIVTAAQYADSRNAARGIESSARAAFSMLELAQNQENPIDLDRNRLQNLIKLYPNTQAAEKASQLLVQSQ